MTASPTLEMSPKLAEVASTIAKGDPPKWLLVGLEHFSGGIAVDTKEDRHNIDQIAEEMQRAVHTLTTWLPAWAYAGYGQKCPGHVALMLYALPRLKKDLDILAKKQIGRPPDVQREVCAAIVLEAWKIIRGKAEPLYVVRAFRTVGLAI